GSFLDQQAARLGVPIEEFGQLALESSSPVRIAGRCSVFAESDMIHKQQLGHSIPDIVAGLCQALVRNYLNNVARSKEIREPVIFQGGVAANEGIKRAFEEELNLKIIIPKQYEVMGAIGAALLARDEVRKKQGKTTFKGLKITEFDYRADSFICEGCANRCEVINIFQEGELIARWGGKCQKHQLQINK
ncbi:MAG: BadF/BadG/BcrA/BcrD ATPase family protein, partial [Halanaerobiales bacterium]